MNTTSKQPKLGSLWVKPEHLTEHNRIVAGLKATINFLVSHDFYASKRIRQLEVENAELKAKLRNFAEIDYLSNKF